MSPGWRTIVVMLMGLVMVACEDPRSPVLDSNRDDRQTVAYPPTRREDVTDRIGSLELKNPYAWLEKLGSEEVESWVDSQSRLTRAMLEGSSTYLKTRLAVYSEPLKIETPVRKGDRFVFMAEPAGGGGPALYSHRNGKDELLATSDNFGAIGMETAQLADFRVSPTGRWVVVSAIEGSTGHREARILDTRTGDYRPDRLEGARLGDEPWAADERFLFYSTREGARPAGVWQRRLDSGAEVRLTAPAAGQAVRYNVSYSDALRGAVAVEKRTDGRHRAVFFETQGTSIRSIPMIDDRGPLSFLGAASGSAFFHSAEGNRILALHRVGDSFEVAELMDTSALAVSTAHLYGGRLVLNGLEEGAPAIMVYDLIGSHLRSFYPPFGLLWTNFPVGRPAIFGDPSSRFAYATSISLDAPGVYELDLELLEMRPWRLREGGSAGDVVVERFTYRSHDGQEIPMTMSHRAALDDGDAPLLLWVYGAHGYTATPYFNGFFRAFIEAGGILAMPQVRGGGVHGPSWHEAGSRAKKKNTILDTVAALEWIRDNAITRPRRVAVLGNSAGSVPAAMAGISRPDLLSALILEIPLSDLVRHAKWSEGWATEFGDPDDPEELSALLEISPYEALQTPKSLPPTLILAGENDRTAPPLHAYKLTAAMQNAQLGNDEILLLRIPGAGHQIGADSEQRRESQALELAFLAKSLEMEFDGR